MVSSCYWCQTRFPFHSQFIHNKSNLKVFILVRLVGKEMHERLRSCEIHPDNAQALSLGIGSRHLNPLDAFLGEACEMSYKTLTERAIEIQNCSYSLSDWYMRLKEHAAAALRRLHGFNAATKGTWRFAQEPCGCAPKRALMKCSGLRWCKTCCITDIVLLNEKVSSALDDAVTWLPDESNVDKCVEIH